MRSAAKTDVVIVHCDGYTIQRFPDGSEYKVRRMIRDSCFIPINTKVDNYSEQIAPQLKPLDEALKERGISRSEWIRQREAAAMSELYGCEVRTTLLR